MADNDNHGNGNAGVQSYYTLLHGTEMIQCRKSPFNSFNYTISSLFIVTTAFPHPGIPGVAEFIDAAILVA